jgi:hypothetical protein
MENIGVFRGMVSMSLALISDPLQTENESGWLLKRKYVEIGVSAI